MGEKRIYVLWGRPNEQSEKLLVHSVLYTSEVDAGWAVEFYKTEFPSWAAWGVDTYAKEGE